MDYNNSEFLVETVLEENEIIESKTDLKGVITYANETFAKISGYSVEELVGKSHNIVRHPDMPKIVFKEMWQTIKEYNIWKGFIKNMTKDGGFYWVHAEVSGVFSNREIVAYKSIQTPIRYEDKLESQIKYDKIRENTKGELKRTVMYQ
ncbi:MAG: PAS domain-containing protein [Candidatus Marinarcus sp.]|uniref:PAS domain-containing protein n=1 Tax=Candidatus Marinarcus sp. TaxID=3100987 RepID=UPI003B00D110